MSKFFAPSSDRIDQKFKKRYPQENLHIVKAI